MTTATSTLSSGEMLSILSVQPCAVDGTGSIAPTQHTQDGPSSIALTHQSLTAHDSPADTPCGVKGGVVTGDTVSQMEPEGASSSSREEKDTVVLTAGAATTLQSHLIAMDASSLERDTALQKHGDESKVGTLLSSQAGLPTSSTTIATTTTMVAPVGSLAPVSEHEERIISSATTRSGKTYKSAASSLEQPLSVVGGSGTDAVSTSVVSTLSSLVSMGNTTFALPLLHTTTVGAALLNISNSSLSSSSWDGGFSPTLHPVTVIDFGGIASPRLVPTPPAGEAVAPGNIVTPPALPPGVKLNPLTAQLPVMMGMSARATIGDALNYVMTRSSSQGTPLAPLIPAHPTPSLIPTHPTPSLIPTHHTPSLIPTLHTSLLIPAPSTPSLIQAHHTPAPSTPSLAPAPSTPSLAPAPSSPPLVPAPSSPPLFSALSTPPFTPAPSCVTPASPCAPHVCIKLPNLAASSVALLPSQCTSTTPENMRQQDTSVSSTAEGFDSELVKVTSLHDSNKVISASPQSQPVSSAQLSTAPPLQQNTAPPLQQNTAPPSQQSTAPSSQQDTAPPLQQNSVPPLQQSTAPPLHQNTAPPLQQNTAPPLQQNTAPPLQQNTAPPSQQDTAPPSQQSTAPPSQQNTASDEGVVPAPEVSSQPSPAMIPDPSVPSPQSNTAEVGGKVTPSPLPPQLYKDRGSPTPPTSNTAGGGGERGSLHFFSAKFRDRYSHLERGDGKGLKRVNYSDASSSAVKRMKGFDPLQPGSPDLFGVPLSQLGAQQSAALIRTETLGGATLPLPRQVIAPVTTQFQRQTVASPKPALGGVTYQKVASSSASSPTAPGTGSGLVAGSNPGMVVGKAPIRETPTRPSSFNPHHLAPSPLQALHLSLQSQSGFSLPPTLSSPVLHTSSISAATHGIHTPTPTSGLLPIPPLVKMSTAVTPQSSSSLPSSSSSPLVSSSSSLLHASIIQNALMRPALTSSAVMGSVTAQLLKPQGEAKPGTTVVRVLSPTPALSSGSQVISSGSQAFTSGSQAFTSGSQTFSSGSQLPPRSRVSVTTVFPSIAVTTTLASSPTPAKSTLVEPKAAILSQSGRENADKTGGTSARTSPPPFRTKVVYTPTITGPRSSPVGNMEGGTEGLVGKGASTNKAPPATPPPAKELQKLTCAIQSRIKQVLEKEPEPEQKALCGPSSPPPPPIPLASRPHASQHPPKATEGTCTSIWVPPPMGVAPASGVGGPHATATPSDRAVQSADRLPPSASASERTVTTASVATFTERSVGTSTERSVGTSTERSVGMSCAERSVSTSMEKSVGTSCAEQRSMAVVSPLPERGAGSERAGVSGLERNADERATSGSAQAVTTGSNTAGMQHVKEECRTDVDGVAVGESDLEKTGEKYSKLCSDEAMESGSEENSETGNAGNVSMDGETQVFSVKLKDCFMHHVMWNNFKMVFLVPLLQESRLATSSELPAVKMEDVNSEEECGDAKDASPSSSQSGVPVTPCFSVYELRTKLFSSFSPSAVYVYTYKNNIRSYKPPIHWVYVMKRMGGVQDTCHTCRLLGMQHVKNICDYYRIKLPSILDMLGRNEIPPGRKVVDLSHVGAEELDQEHIDLIPSCAFVDTPSKVQSKLPRKRGRKYVQQGKPSPPTPSEQSESVDNVMEQCDGYGGNNSFNRYQSVGKKKPCPQCGTNILKKCKKCPLCGKTFGLFAFGRRQCTSCGRVNLAKYTNCNKCGANLQNAPIALPKDDETGDSPQPPPEYVCKRRRLHNLPVTYSSRDHEDGETPLGGGPPLSRRASTAASDADEEMVDYGEEFDVDCPDDLEMSSAKSPSKSRHTGYQYGRVPWANTEVAVLVDEKGILRFCLHELCTRVLTEHSKADVFNMVKDLNLPMEQGDMPLLKKLQALGMHSNRSPICRLIMAEDLWALLDALQEPVPDEVHQHLETVTLNTHFNTSFPSSPAPPPASRPSQLNISQSPEPFTTPTLPAVQDSPAMMLNPGTTPVVAEDESGFESTLHEMQCSDGQFVSILRAWSGGQYVCLPEVWRKYFPEVNRNNLTGVLKKLDLDTHLPTGQQATLLRSAGVISLRGAPGRLMKLEDMQALLDSFGIPLQIGSGKAPTPAKQASNQTTPKPRPSNIAPKPVVRTCDEHPVPILKDNPASIDSLLAHCMQNILVALGSEDIEKLLKECAQSGFEASALAEQEAIGVAAELNGIEQLIAARRELCLVLNKEIGYLRATSQGYMAEIVRQNSIQRQALQDAEDHLTSLGILLNSEDSIYNSHKPYV